MAGEILEMHSLFSWKITALTLRCLNKLRYILWENEKKNLGMNLSLGPISLPLPLNQAALI